MWHIPRPLINKILGYAQRTAPRECVGLLSGHGRTATHWHPIPNIAPGNDRYLADPASHIEQFRQIREAGRELVAICHSHPQGDVTPSATDVREAYYPEALQIIISMSTEGRLELQGYLIADGQIQVQEIFIEG